jgi:hypothetical protein
MRASRRVYSALRSMGLTSRPSSLKFAFFGQSSGDVDAAGLKYCSDDIVGDVGLVVGVGMRVLRRFKKWTVLSCDIKYRLWAMKKKTGGY